MRITCTLLLIVLTCVGCRSSAQSGRGGPDTIDSDAVRRIRADCERANPASRVGVIVETLPLHALVKVVDVPPADFQVNDEVTFIDTTRRMLTTGKVVRILPDCVHVRYDWPPGALRQPRVGDIMIKVPFGARPL